MRPNFCRSNRQAAFHGTVFALNARLPFAAIPHFANERYGRNLLFNETVSPIARGH